MGEIVPSTRAKQIRVRARQSIKEKILQIASNQKNRQGRTTGGFRLPRDDQTPQNKMHRGSTPRCKLSRPPFIVPLPLGKGLGVRLPRNQEAGITSPSARKCPPAAPRTSDTDSRSARSPPRPGTGRSGIPGIEAPAPTSEVLSGRSPPCI